MCVYENEVNMSKFETWLTTMFIQMRLELCLDAKHMDGLECLISIHI